MNCCCWLILYSRTRTRVPNSMCLDHLHKYQVERRGGISPSNLWKKLWMIFFLLFFFWNKCKKRWSQKGSFELQCIWRHLMLPFKTSCPEHKFVWKVWARKENKNLKKTKNKNISDEAYWVALNFPCNNQYLETGNTGLQSHWRQYFFFFLCSGNLNTINLYVNIGQATISFFCHVIPISSIIWRCNALIGLFNPMKTFWVFQKYLLLHKYLCIHGCFSCHVGCFMILFTSVFWCIYCFTGSSASNRVQKIFDKIGYFSV